MHQPGVTVVIPCFNYGRFVADAARSALVQQGFDPGLVRVVIVDDGSTDGTTPAACDACADLPGAADRVRVVHQENLGLPAARNAGAAGATTPLLLFLDADDHLAPTALADLAGALAGEERAGRGGDVSHAYGQQTLSELGHGTWRVPEWDPLLLGITNLHAATALVRRDRFEAVGGYAPDMRDGYEDWDLWLKFAERGWRGVRVRRPVFVWRRHSHDTMIHRSLPRHDELYQRLIDRHRAYYERHALRLVARANTMLARAGATWLDEDLEPIFIRDMKSWNADLVRERDDARAQLAEARARLGEAERQLAALETQPAVRATRAAHRALDRLPGALSRPVRGLARRLGRALAG
ncbi:MAG TPA: glycosyltransferase [Phycisphaerales bacterium]|nr:glycosyltransferase [Phycisphaerales bacterium]